MTDHQRSAWRLKQDLNAPRTIYMTADLAPDGHGELVGVMDTDLLAKQVCEAYNRWAKGNDLEGT